MRLDEFDYILPPELIAQQPASPRDAARLLVVHRAAGTFEHRVFHEIGDYLRAGDVLVVNDTRVLPARLRGRRPTGGAVELLLLRPAGDAWEALVRPGRRLPPGTVVEVAGHPVTVGERLPDGRRLVRAARGEDLVALMDRCGELPLPPYIRRSVTDPAHYQTVYARADGAVAAPTAGLHFTPALLARLQAQGIAVVALTLHIGLATFQRVDAAEIEGHRMEGEAYVLTADAAAAINARRGRLVAVGTSTVRALESVAGDDGRVRPGAGWTELFIYPGFRFRATDVLVTNFHLPRTTLLVLVSAFAGRELILRAYAEAIRARYRFYSFGDAMLIL
ncbi:MAG: tRNA preQ1(34) S-adenosylmethionine ribosyltransferase-isomerase QueA [Armatimonadota bacterium]|nr:tRNA preQ1(34) S-adenosylmethionine ribosyltransferase-isomerase QueA [Armatimonadota bacterium]MDR7533361.1 tRNA preQ1(34) S-adenosylmethionine ribosyltransferase-isomerase QueA [Armatimonadota bacterium]MDR7536481.1 tRNA preQ1(34) S-adenosylmethionine ribosyltransferase-isomerase QueA [Armatimonadota bacterium]